MKEKYQLAVEALAYLLAWGPDFPPWIGRTSGQTFEQLCGCLDELLAAETRPVSLVGIARCREVASRSRELLNGGNHPGAKLDMEYAILCLCLAAKGKPAPECSYSVQSVLKSNRVGTVPRTQRDTGS